MPAFGLAFLSAYCAHLFLLLKAFLCTNKCQ
ncbi:hypothetical protein GJM86_06645 [Vibrio parahaemolyticus]|nr:hypothetical protein [Vibrio parahaemolyticus]EGQ8147845.1 hypothetical protein [Vibrio parahaemolyticus]EGQ8253278.1 hypothetical protein [Vibrio parahaemolyticus]EGQ8264174.1 hypothetical protein [Vibrio parahaemolyticus]EGQ8272030.1 hypothetical protein [Vibrio parahaemolyticus]